MANTAARRKHGRRNLIALVLCLMFGVAGTIATAQILLNTDRVRTLAESAVVHYTGIEMRIETLHASLWSGRVIATGVALAVPDAHANIERVAVRVDLRRLLAREIAIDRGDISGLVLHLPEDVTQVNEIVERVQQTVKEKTGDRDGPAVVDVSIAEIAAAAHVYLGEDSAPFATADLRIGDLLTSRIRVSADAQLLAWGEAARIYGGVELLRAEPGSPWQADGSAWLRGVQTQRLPLTNPPDGVFAVDMAFMPTDPGPGAEIHARLIVPSQPEITSASSVRGVWTGEEFDVAELTWQSSGARLAASGSFASLDDWRLSVSEARAAEVSLDAILALFERPRARFEADPQAEVILADFEADSIDGDWQIARGNLEFSGITIVSQLEGNPAEQGIAQATRGLRGKATAADGLITVHEIRSDDLHVSGTLATDRANRALHVDVKADVDLARMPWTLLNERGDLEHVQGKLSVTKFSGTFAGGNAPPDDLVIEGALREGRLKYSDDVLTVEAHDLRGTFATAGGRVSTGLSAVDANGTTLTVAGGYDVAARTWAGTLDGDPSRLVPPLLASLDAADEIYSGTSVFGPSVFDLRAEFPAADRDGFTLTVARRDDGTAALDATIIYANDALGIDARATAPADRVLAEYFPHWRTEGALHASFNYNQAAKRYTFAADATAVGFQTESILQKAAGIPFTFALNGNTAETWTIDTIEATLRGEPALRTTGPLREGFVPFEVNLAPMAALLADGATLGGAIRGTVRTDPFGGDFNFDNAAIALSPEVALDRIHGAVRITPEVFSCESLEIDGARSDATITLMRMDNRWSGAATGTKLDVEAIAELAEAVQALRPAAQEPAEPVAPRSLWDDPFIGEFTLNLDEFYYNRGKLDAVAFRILGEPRAIRIPEFSARTGEGTLLGSVVVLPGESTDAVVKSALKWTALDGRAVGSLLFAEDRKFFGVLDGELTFDAPFGDYKTMLAGGSGSARWTARDGSLGEIGFASKLLTALRTTEIITLRVPSLKDQGLTYKTWTGDIAMTAGVMTLKSTQLDGGAYVINGDGTVDFAAEKTNVQTFTRVLESVGKVVGSVPIIGDIATALSTDLVGVPVNFSGSPYDLHVSIVAATGKSLATTPLRAGEGALKAVGEGLKKLIPGGGNKNNGKATSEPKETEPAPPQ